MKNKKGQEEIVGFVVIVVIMALVLIVILGFSMRSGYQVKTESRDVSNFLYSSMEYTSDCALQYEPAYSKLGELLKECYQGNKCLDGNDACTDFKVPFTAMLDESFKVGTDRPIKGYIFNVTYQTNSSSAFVFAIKKGECAGKIQGAEYITPMYPGDIIGALEICT
ncbi:MAG: hypothetical protein WCK90_02660 [archaeon]